MSDDKCPNCGYCPHCGRRDEVRPLVPVLPDTATPVPFLSGFRCACGAWVGSHQVHVCPVSSGPHWSSGNITLAGGTQ
jgi:hypothetical protein